MHRRYFQPSVHFAGGFFLREPERNTVRYLDATQHAARRFTILLAPQNAAGNRSAA
jgi:hypothetical protein